MHQPAAVIINDWDAGRLQTAQGIVFFIFQSMFVIGDDPHLHAALMSIEYRGGNSLMVHFKGGDIQCMPHSRNRFSQRRVQSASRWIARYMIEVDLPPVANKAASRVQCDGHDVRIGRNLNSGRRRDSRRLSRRSSRGRRGGRGRLLWNFDGLRFVWPFIDDGQQEGDNHQDD